ASRRPLASLPRRELPIAVPSPGPEAEASPPPPATARTLRTLPPELAGLLISVGCVGLVLPGLIGTPAIVAGGLALWPKAFGPAEAWLERRAPAMHRKGLDQIYRFLDDLDRRYP